MAVKSWKWSCPAGLLVAVLIGCLAGCGSPASKDGKDKPKQESTGTAAKPSDSAPAAKDQPAEPKEQPKKEPAEDDWIPAPPKKTTPPAQDGAAAPKSDEPAAKKSDVPAAPKTEDQVAKIDNPPPKVEEPVVKPEDAGKMPLGLPELKIPDDNPMTPEKVELGKLLYFDKRLSADGTISCATCHDPKMGWAEREATSKGVKGQVGARNSPTVINAAYARAQFWDGRAATLEAQALGPIENPIEMGHKLDVCCADLSKIDGYRERFKKVFGTEVTKDGIAKAIAAFERTVISGNSPYDKFLAGDANALTEAQKHGLATFKKAGCSMCHSGKLMSDYQYYNAGVGMDKPKPDAGRKDVTKNDDDLGAFRTPSLREVANTGPYFHDGSAATLEDAVALMAAGGKDNAHLSPAFSTIREAKLTEQDRKDLVEFLKALSGEFPVVEPPNPL